MPVYNVEARVIQLVHANSPEGAADKVRAALQRAGFTVDDQDRSGDVFVSDDQSLPADLP